MIPISPKGLPPYIHCLCYQDGQCVEILHIGSFDDEPASFEKMEEFAKQNGLLRNISCHREIYLNNANRVPKSKLQTILRYQARL